MGRRLNSQTWCQKDGSLAKHSRASYSSSERVRVGFPVIIDWFLGVPFRRDQRVACVVQYRKWITVLVLCGFLLPIQQLWAMVCMSHSFHCTYIQYNV
jgi:hypothetical protein